MLAALALAAAGTVRAGEAESLALWSDPEFERQFLGTYGVNAEIEPRVTVVEKDLMEKVPALMRAEGGLEKASAFLEKNWKPASSAILDFTLGNIGFQQNDLETAAAWYTWAIQKFPSFQRAHKNLGLVQVRAGAYDKAVTPLTRAIELGATDGLTFGLLGYAYLMTERFSQAESAYRQAMMLQPDTVDWKLGLVRALFKERKHEEAATLCGDLIRGDPSRPDYWLLQANAFLGMKQTLKAAENFEYLDFMGAANAQSLNTLGDIYVNEGLTELGADAYIRAIAKDPEGDPKRFLRDGEVLAARSAHADASRLIARIKEAFGPRLGTEEKKRILKLEARMAAARGVAAEEQMKLLQEIVALDPLDGETLILLGQREAAGGNVEKACFYYERAEGLDKYEAEARLRHGQCLVRNSRYEEALPLLKRAQELRPRDDVARYVEQVERAARARN